MCDVTRHNFEEILPRVQNCIQNCNFVAIDTEFSALSIDEAHSTSLFDDSASRYYKLRDTASKSIILQFGLSIFTQDSSLNYISETFNFYLCPKSFGNVIDDRFICQASSFEFLSRYNFNFTKTFNEGISYLNKTQESKLHLEAPILFSATHRNISPDEEEMIENICHEIRQDPTKDDFDMSSLSAGAKYVLYEEIRTRCPHLSTMPSFLDKIPNTSIMLEQIIQQFKGFSRVIQFIIENKKPVVAHNCLYDIMRIYHQFVDDLPSSYEDFKREFHKSFPEIYDTKHLAFCSRRAFEEESESLLDLADMLRDTSLGELYKNIFPGIGKQLHRSRFVHLPQIIHAQDNEKYLNSPDLSHEAGFDAFMSGTVFIYLAHTMAGLNYLTFRQMKPLRFFEQLGSVEKFRNMINMGRGAISYVNLEQSDPPSKRPAYLFVSSRSSFTKSSFQIAELLARYGSVDVKVISPTESIVAVSNHRSAEEILSAFRNSSKLQVTKYNAWKHDKRRRLILLIGGSSAVGLLSLFMWLHHRK